MGLFSGIGHGIANVGKAVKKAVVDTGHVAGKVATNPWVEGLTAAGLAATGVGAGPAAALLASMKGGGNLIKPGGNLKSAATGAGQGALLGGAAGLAGKVVHPLAVSALNKFTGGGGPAGAESAPGGGSENDPYGDGRPTEFDPLGRSAAGTVAGAGGGIMDYLKQHGGQALGAAKDFITGNGGMNALGLAQGLNAVNLQKHSTDLANNAVTGLQQNYEGRAPLRVAGMQGMLAPKTADLSGLTANAGPYGKGLPAIAPAKAYV